MKDFLSTAEEKQVIEAIANAEKNTSGEIRVHMEASCKEDVLDRAAEVFAYLNMHKTSLRNGVLFYFALKDHKFAVIGDAGINAVVPSNFWDEIRDILQKHFAQKKFAEGLIKGITLAGEQLKAHFPYKQDDKNELSNEISFGK